MAYICSMKKEWHPLKNYEGLYEISTDGEIKGIHGKITRGWNCKYNYKKVKLYKNSKHKDFYVHRLVALQFIPQIPNKTFVNHIDNNPSNNCVSNLEWCSHYENMQHAKNQNRMNKDGNRVRRKLDGKIYKSIQEAAIDNGLLANTILYQFRRKSAKCLFELI